MSGNSKREMVASMLKRAMNETMAECAINNPDNAAWLRQNRGWFAWELAGRISNDPYRMKELVDIINWKKPPKEK